MNGICTASILMRVNLDTHLSHGIDLSEGVYCMCCTLASSLD